MDDDYAGFVARARPSLVVFARSLGRFDDAEDVVQTALAKVMRFWPRLVDESFPRRYAYAKRAVANEGRTFWRRYGAKVSLTEDGEVDQGPSLAPGTAEVATDHASLYAALQSLPAHQQKILWLRYCAGACDQEIANQLGYSQVTVRTASLRGLQALRSALAA